MIFTWLQESYQWKNTLYFTCMQHEMLQSLLVFAVSLTQEISNFGAFGGVVHPF